MFIKRIKGLFSVKVPSTRRGHDELEAEHLRILFKSRYQSFRLLLTANNETLFLMSELEKALSGEYPFSMSFIRSKCTSVLVNVFNIIKNLDELGDGKYKKLYTVYHKIRETISATIENEQKKETLSQEDVTIRLEQTDMSAIDYVGSKMARLGEIKKNADFFVPDGFVITSSAYKQFFEHNSLQEEINRRIQAQEENTIEHLHRLSSGIQQLIINSEAPKAVEKGILDAYTILSDNGKRELKICLRSSAIGEDALNASYAGQYVTKLNVPLNDILSAYKEVVASKYNLAAITYRMNKGLRDEDTYMCVGCMELIEASSGGVIYTANPIDDRDDSIIINSVLGLPESVVNGVGEVDVFVISKSVPFKIIKREIAKKQEKTVCNNGDGLRRERISDSSSLKASLSDEQILCLAAIAVKLEKRYGRAQDVEWAIDANERIYVLQCRGLKRIKKQAGNLDVAGQSGLSNTEGAVTASPGAASGAVFNIKKHSDMMLFPKGAILITRQALPIWAALMGQASAIITEEGTALGHLASVAREFRIPAIFNVPKAVDLFENGHIITIDADRCAIFDGRNDEVIASRAEHSADSGFVMKDTPVFNVLKDISGSILPLTLLNPSSPDFVPGNCKTLHDIIRYCHEKAVEEIFSFGKSHHFSERSSKQLICKSPLTWWVINLDDGFKEDVRGGYVYLENIDSAPFTALWEGINAFAWQGPPTLDAVGFISIVFESVYNSSLNPAAMNSNSNNNYFLLSRHFCSLTSRLGYHLASVEAIVGERAGENYAKFFFKGGAADYTRRAARTLFLSEILEEFGFRTEIIEDSLSARVDKEDALYMTKQLKLIVSFFIFITTFTIRRLIQRL
ncbi:pyruvate, water dikinase [Candidatus Magnetoovum chiemensis]|nr:pyruvate, water dikinase [Candidatus Magnetoovum chiemensis]